MKAFLISVFGLVLSACASNMPAPSVSEYVKTEGGGFIIERDKGIRYGMTYSLLKSSEAATSYKAVFENTIPNGKPLAVEQAIEPGTPKLIVQSPIIPGVKNNHTYSVSLTIYTGNTQLTLHNDQVKFSVPSDALAQFGIVEY